MFHNGSHPGGPLRFKRLQSETTDLQDVTGAYPIDIDSDGLIDLVVLRRGENVLLRGLGQCMFERSNEAWGFDGGDAWTTAFSATFEEDQSWPTFAFGTYIDHIDDQGIAHCGDGALLRPAQRGAGFAAPNALQPGHCALSMLFSDWGRTGQRDLRVSNDRHYYYSDGEEELWKVDPGEAPRQYTLEDGWQPVQIYGMGIASQDVTGDGLPEVYLTSIGSNRLKSLAGDPSSPDFMDFAGDSGITATTPWIGRPIYPSTSWHPEFEDVNNDGHMDLYVSKGNVDAVPDNAMKDPNELFLGRDDGHFTRAAKQAGILNPMRSRGAAVVDLNADGLLDLVEVNREENVSLWRNVGSGTAGKPRSMGHWLDVALKQDGANRDAIGSWIEVKAGKQITAREVTVGGGHVSGELGPVHFGLGTKGRAQVRVTWPDGTQGQWHPTATDRTITLEPSADDTSPTGPEGA